MNPQEDLLLVCDEVKADGERLHQAALEFSHDTLDTERRETMVTASRTLLMAVTRLMVVVDAVDIQRMFRISNRVCMCVCMREKNQSPLLALFPTFYFPPSP